MTEEELGAALLTVEDMPIGWTVVASDEDGSAFGFSAQAPTDRSLFTVERQFQKDGAGAFFSQAISAYSPGSGDATAAISDTVSEIEALTPFTSTQIDGSTLILEVAFMSFPALGDESVAARYSSDQFPLFGFVQVDGVLIREGDVIMTLASISLGTQHIDLEQLEALAHRALEKQDEVLENRE